jgi:uncharacterized membrane protein YbhN (UPF0104 family)
MTDQESPTPRNRPPRLLLRLVKWSLFAAGLILVGRALVAQFAEMSWEALRFDPWLMAAGAACVLASKAVTFQPYGLLLDRFCPRPPWKAMAATVWVSQIGKYIPGKVGAVAGMALLLRRYDVPARMAVVTMIIVDGLSVAVGMLVAIPVMRMEPMHSRLPTAWIWSLVALAAALVCVHPRVFKAASNVVLKRLGYEPFESLPGMQHYAGPTASLVGQYALLGVGYWLMAGAMGPLEPASLPMFCCAVVVATIGGFLAIFAPGGLGVQEGLMLLLLTPLVGGQVAALVTVLMRLVQTLAEVLLAVVGLMMMRHGPTADQAKIHPAP